MFEPAPELHPVPRTRGKRDSLAAVAVAATLVVFAFLTGVGVGGARPEPSPSPPPISTASALTPAQIDRQLWTAYLNRPGNGWGLCAVAATISCQMIGAVPAQVLPHFERLSLQVSQAEWGALTPITVPPGHYVLAGPMPYVGGGLTFSRIAADGTGTLIGPMGQAVLNGAVWADLGSLDLGRYLGVATAYGLSESHGLMVAPYLGWALAISVANH